MKRWRRVVDSAKVMEFLWFFQRVGEFTLPYLRGYGINFIIDSVFIDYKFASSRARQRGDRNVFDPDYDPFEDAWDFPEDASKRETWPTRPRRFISDNWAAGWEQS
jgi:hypothetical protein